MIDLICVNILETLGLEWQKLLLYLANFIVLAVVLTFLVYKPVKKFMSKRQEEIKNQCEAAANAKQEAEVKIAEMQKSIDEKNEELKVKSEEVNISIAKTEEERAQIIANANLKAEEIINEASARAEEDRLKAIKDNKKEMVDVSIKIASGILQREINEKDHEDLIDKVIEDWKNND